MPFKIPLIFSQRENMSFCIYVPCQSNVGAGDLAQFYCLNRTPQFVTSRVCSQSHSVSFGKSLRTRPTCTWVPCSTVDEVISESSASQCICSVFSSWVTLLFLGKATQRSIVLSEWARLMNLSFCCIWCDAWLWPIILLILTAHRPLCHALPGFNSTDNATEAICCEAELMHICKNNPLGSEERKSL